MHAKEELEKIGLQTLNGDRSLTRSTEFVIRLLCDHHHHHQLIKSLLVMWLLFRQKISFCRLIRLILLILAISTQSRLLRSVNEAELWVAPRFYFLNLLVSKPKINAQIKTSPSLGITLRSEKLFRQPLEEVFRKSVKAHNKRLRIKALCGERASWWNIFRWITHQYTIIRVHFTGRMGRTDSWSSSHSSEISHNSI